MASLSSSSSRIMLDYALVFGTFMAASVDNFYNDNDITWGDGCAKIFNNGVFSLSLDKAFGTSFQSKNEYFFGKIDM